MPFCRIACIEHDNSRLVLVEVPSEFSKNEDSAKLLIKKDFEHCIRKSGLDGIVALIWKRSDMGIEYFPLNIPVLRSFVRNRNWSFLNVQLTKTIDWPCKNDMSNVASIDGY